MKKGKFIVFEGIDGCGKSTQSALLHNFLKKNNIPCQKTAEPTEGEIGLLLRKYLSGKAAAPASAMAMLFAADRLEHITSERDGILSLLEDGITVICDRYVLSSCAYQAEEIGLKEVIGLNQKALSLCPPDLTVLLEISPRNALSRIDSRGSREYYEGEGRLMKTAENYNLAISALGLTKDNLLRVDAMRSEDEISSVICGAAMKLFQ